jgi:L-amino acid N-acyltransferase
MTLPGYQIIECNFQDHAQAILNIYNEAIINSTALYDYHPRTMDNMVAWFKDKRLGQYPVVGVTNESKDLMGFASYGVFRARPAYKYSVEHSVYVHVNHRGKGIGKILMAQIIERAKAQQYHLLVGGIDADNQTSIVLHEKFGFTHSGTVTQAGFKFGRWLDVAFYQLILETPHQPVDG